MSPASAATACHPACGRLQTLKLALASDESVIFSVDGRHSAAMGTKAVALAFSLERCQGKTCEPGTTAATFSAAAFASVALASVTLASAAAASDAPRATCVLSATSDTSVDEQCISLAFLTTSVIYARVVAHQAVRFPTLINTPTKRKSAQEPESLRAYANQRAANGTRG